MTLPFLISDDAGLRRILERARTIAVVGASADPARASYGVAKYLERAGYDVVRVNPHEPGMVADLSQVGRPIDIVDVFRRPDQVLAHAEEAVRVGAKVLWLQLGVIAPEAAQLAHRAGLEVVMDHCTLREHHRLLAR